MKIITCHGVSFFESNQAKEDAACAAIKRLRKELGFEVKDVNFEDKKYYKNLHDRIYDEHLELQDEYEMFNFDFDLLKKRELHGFETPLRCIISFPLRPHKSVLYRSICYLKI
uniref:Uncharacterized protein n=1 Tax=Ananas comosus var. bracteatus TaxID=296719 RepID=A0A6V7PS37_ANACO|nr:unnamed protein product [Ananas comosus var. bracteatus]